MVKGKFGNYLELDLKDDDTEKFFKILGEQLQSLAGAYLNKKPWNLKSPIVEYGIFYSVHCKIPQNFNKLKAGEYLQGYCEIRPYHAFSGKQPLAFNMVINTFIQFIKNEKYQQFGYNFIKYMIPRHWYQFADDAAVVTGLEHENQVLLNAFNSWCTWADMVIRVDKCSQRNYFHFEQSHKIISIQLG